MSLLRLRFSILLLAVFALPLAGVRAADPPPDPKPVDEPAEKQVDAEKPAESEEQKEDEEDEEESEDRYFALLGGHVHTITNGDLHNATILTKNGKIHEIGTTVELPEETETLDISGYEVYPGLVAVGSSSLFGADPPDKTTDVYSLQMTLALAGGITTALTGNTAAKLSHGSVDDLVVKRDVFETLQYSTRKPNARRKLREAFEKARQFLRDLETYEEKKKLDPEAEEPDKEWMTDQHKTCLKLVRHEAVAVMSAGTAKQLLQACDLATRYNILVVVRGAHEGWTVASEMARAGLSAIVTPRTQRGADQKLNRPSGSSIENAATLTGHGVPVAVIPGNTSITTWGVAGRDLLHLNMEAAFAVRGGLSNEAALRTITIDAARILGIDHRVGSIEIGKDADFFVCKGDPLHYMTSIRWTVVNGKIVYDKAKEPLFSHIRPGGDPNAPAPDDYWPRRLGEDR